MATKKEHTYGSGKLFFAPYLPGTQTPGARKYIGNTTELTLTSEQETLDHYDTDNGVNEKDDTLVTSQEQSGTFVTDNISASNVAMFLQGEAKTVSQTSATALTLVVAVVEHGLYQLGQTATNPSGDRNVTNVVVTDGASSGPVTYVAGVDYVVDAARGQVEILDTGSVDLAKGLKVTYDRAVSTRSQVVSGQKTVEGELYFLSKNPVGPQRDYLFPRVKLTPNGDLPLKGEDWIKAPFNIEALKKGDLATVYADGLPVAA